MTTLREAAQQALEALEATHYDVGSAEKQRLQTMDAITALRAALEQQEPVAWQWLDTGHFRKKLPVDAEPGAWNPLYTHPPRREWQGLTTQEAMSLTDTVPRGTFYGCDAGIGLGIWIAAVAAAERALKEKNT